MRKYILPSSDSAPLILTITVFISFISFYLIVLGAYVHPGHGDPAFYVEMAERIYSRGDFTINYAWHYLGDSSALPRYAFDYWLPGTSLVQSFAMVLLVPLTESSLIAAGIASLLFPLPLVGIGFHLTRLAGVNSYRALTYGILLYLMVSAAYSIDFQSTVYAATMYISVIYFSTLYFLNNRLRWVALSFSFAAFGYWFRGDAILLFPVLLLYLLIYPPIGFNRLYSLLICAGIYFSLLIPLFSLNSVYGGFIAPPSAPASFLTEYTDLFLYKPNDISDVLSYGLKNRLLDTLNFFLGVGAWYLRAAAPLSVGFLALLVIPAALFSRTPKMNDAVYMAGLTSVSLTILYTGFYGVVLPFFEDGHGKTVVGLLVFSTWAGALYLGSRVTVSGFVMTAMVAIVTLYVGMAVLSNLKRDGNQNILARYMPVCQEMMSEGEESNPTIMTRQVWELSYICDGSYVQIPSDSDRDLVISAIRDYEVDLLLLEKKWLDKRPAFEHLYGKGRTEIGDVKFKRLYSDLSLGIELYMVEYSEN